MSTFHKFTGILEASSLTKPDDYNRWWIKIKFDEDSLEKFKASGIQTKLTDDGCTYLRRPVTLTKLDGTIVQMEPIKCYGPDKKPIEASKIGWGSKIITGVVTYPTKKGNGHRVDFIGALELVEFSGKDALDEPW